MSATATSPVALANLGPGHPVEERSTLPRRLFSLTQRRRPMVFRGLAASWPARRTWAPAALSAGYSDHAVPVAALSGGVMRYAEGEGMRFRQRPVGELLVELAAATQEAPAAEFGMVRPSAWPPDLLADLPLPERIRAAHWHDVRMTIAGAGSLTPVHREFHDNLYVLLHGRKDVALLAPANSRALAAHGPLSGVPHLSPVDPRVVDFTRYPAARGCVPARCQLDAGDVLYIPRGWWHIFATLELSVGAGMWWANGPAALLPTVAALYKRALGIAT